MREQIRNIDTLMGKEKEWTILALRNTLESDIVGFNNFMNDKATREKFSGLANKKNMKRIKKIHKKLFIALKSIREAEILSKDVRCFQP
jgi:hypothetical protein